MLRQHLIDPEICIRCNTCEETCPVDAITHDARNYVVDAAKCNSCNECISPCPTGAIDNWRQVDRTKPYTLAEQLGWDSAAGAGEIPADVAADAEMPAEVARDPLGRDGRPGRRRSAAVVGRASVRQSLRARAVRRSPRSPATIRLTADGASADIRHIVLDFGGTAFPVLEGQTIGIVPPGNDASGTTASRPPLLDREPARRRAAALQQPLAYREARHRGPRRQRGPRRRVELPLRSEEGRRGEGRRPLRRVVPDAQPSRARAF